MSARLRKLIGTRAFYAMVLAVVVPIIIQNAITNFVNLLDNLMVGRTGTDPMSGVAIANQLLFVFNLAIFGSVSGAGIFTAQYHGAGDLDGVRASYRYKLYCSLILSAITIALFLTCSKGLISLYLTDTSDPARVQRTLGYAQEYLRIILIGLPPFAIAQCYASTLRECGETKLPMLASVSAVLVNLVFNYLLIFGKLGFPRLGVAGAAWATTLSRYVELAIILWVSHRHPERFPFVKGLYRTLKIPSKLVWRISVKGIPLLANELCWALGMVTLNQIYSIRGLDVVAATNISSTVFNLFSTAFLSMGSAAAIIVGQVLGANDAEKAKDYSAKLLAFSVFFSLIVSGVLLIFSGAIPMLYKTSDSVHVLAAALIRACCYLMPCNALCNTSYFIMRSGGKTMLTFIFDSVFIWCVSVALAYALAHFTGMSIVPLFFLVHLADLPKAIFGIYLVNKGIWIHNIVSAKAE